MTRKEFITKFSSLGVVLGAGMIHSLHANELFNEAEKVKLRFLVASDAHYGQPDTPYEQLANTFVSKANTFHHQFKCDFCILNGDIIHDNPEFMPAAHAKFSELKMPIYATQGNHDHLTPEAWQQIWDTPVNYAFNRKGYQIVLVTTSDEKGTYLAPDLGWLSKTLDSLKEKTVLLFVHIPQKKWTKHAIDTPAFFDLIEKHPNIKAIFHGHEHDQDGIYWNNEIPFIFDSHIGGSWGTTYKGFRVVEVLKNGNIVTYMMNPDVAMEKTNLKGL